jgi:lipopolysaccharide/colanic/teichoic acid biosynthesis glycosyltransferase/nucleoside-diphosphate-sugar epimerase
MKKILLTGATGFLGKHLLPLLFQNGFDVYSVHRKKEAVKDKNSIYVSSIDATTDWGNYLVGIDIVVHSAALVHKMSPSVEEKKLFYDVNVAGTENLAREAIAKGVQKFIYISSIKVNGDLTQEKPFHRSDEHKPTDDYGKSKSLAEQKLIEICQNSNMKLVILRPVLVYGPGVRANFLALLKLIQIGVPLPFGAVENSRSMIYVENLTDLILTCARKSDIPSILYLVSDKKHYSLPDLIRAIAKCSNKPARLFALPDFFFRLGQNLPIVGGYLARLTSSLEVDSTETFSELNWQPPYSLELGISKTLEWFAKNDAPKSNRSKNLYFFRIKGLIDVFLSSLMIVSLLPVFLLTALMIYLDDPGKIFFIQTRAGKDHQPFQIYKFRTMKMGTPSISTEEMRKSGIDPITKVGRILRRTSLDEIPQLINVIKGEMSLVGPRPALMSQTKVLEGRERTGSSGLLPGITGLAQALGRDDLADDEKILFDKTYSEKISFSFDVYVCFLTVKALFSAKGAH